MVQGIITSWDAGVNCTAGLSEPEMPPPHLTSCVLCLQGSLFVEGLMEVLNNVFINRARLDQPLLKDVQYLRNPVAHEHSGVVRPARLQPARTNEGCVRWAPPAALVPKYMLFCLSTCC